MIKKHWTNLGRALCLRSEVSVKSLLSQKKADKAHAFVRRFYFVLSALKGKANKIRLSCASCHPERNGVESKFA